MVIVSVAGAYFGLQELSGSVGRSLGFDGRSEIAFEYWLPPHLLEIPCRVRAMKMEPTCPEKAENRLAAHERGSDSWSIGGAHWVEEQRFRRAHNVWKGAWGCSQEYGIYI